VQLLRLTIREGEVRWVAPAGAGVRAVGIEALGRADLGPSFAQGELRLRSRSVDPGASPGALDLAFSLRDGQLTVPLLKLAVGDTALDLVAEGNLPRRQARLAVTTLAVSADQVQSFAPRTPLAGDLLATAFGLWTGDVATVSLEVKPAGDAPSGDRGGRAQASAAVRLDGPVLAAGFALEAHQLDPSRVLSVAPAGALDLSGRGRMAGSRWPDLQGSVSLSIGPSRLRLGRFGPGTLSATVVRGAVQLQRLELSVPGATLRGSGRYSERGPSSGALSGVLSIDGRDLALLSQNLSAALGRPLPPLAGALQADAVLSGTAAEPQAQVSAAGQRVWIGAAPVRLRDLTLRADLRGPVSGPSLQLQARAGRVHAPGLRARDVALSGALDGDALELQLRASVPSLGRDPLAFGAAGRFTDRRTRLLLSALTLTYPGSRFALVRPAAFVLAGPRVDRLELAAGPQRIAIEGGLGGRRHQVLDLRLELDQLDLALLPPGVLPEGLGASGRLSLSARARGPLQRPTVEGQLGLSGGSLQRLTGLDVQARFRLDGEPWRARVDLAATRALGGALQLSADVPVDLPRAPPDATVSVRLALRAIPVPELTALVRAAPPLDGRADLLVTMGGTIGAPTLTGSASLSGGAWAEYGGLGARAQLQAPGREARLTLSVDVDGFQALAADVRFPLDLAAALRDPAGVGRALGSAPLNGLVRVPNFELATLARRSLQPVPLSGRLDAELHLRGSLTAPRVAGTLALADLAYAGYHDLNARGRIDAGDRATRVELDADRSGQPLLRAVAVAGRPLEGLTSRKRLEEAPLSVDATLSPVELASISSEAAPLPLAGTLRGAVRAQGTFAAPTGTVQIEGRDLRLGDHPLGALTVQGSYRTGTATLDGLMGTPGRGSLRLAARIRAAFHPGMRGSELAEAPVEVRLSADQLDLGFLAAVAPEWIRSSGGKLTADLSASGPLAHVLPRGEARLTGGEVTLAELGAWSDVELDASISEDDFKVVKLSARHGSGTVQITAEGHGLAQRAGPVQLQAKVRAHALNLSRAGQDLATVTCEVDGQGQLAGRDLRAEVRIPSAEVRLPARRAHPLQSLEERPDITVIRAGKKPTPPRPAAPATAPRAPLHAQVHLVVPRRFFVRSEEPRIDLELKADATAEWTAGELLATGTVQTVRGEVEPVSDRLFRIDRGRVVFTGGPVEQASLDVVAIYDNPAAKVSVLVTGPVTHPQVKLTSVPALDEGQIAMLIATGRTELKAGGGGVGLLSGEEAGRAALGALSSRIFRSFNSALAEKLPVDVVSVDSSELRAGKYLTNKLYLGYTRRFAAQPELGENSNEVRVEYQLTPRWNFEARFGDVSSGGALIWSKDY
jgi:translocation and assembly module TamB